MNKDDLSRSAAGMLRIYGRDAEQQAQDQARKFTTRGNTEGAETWQAIARAVHDHSAAERDKPAGKEQASRPPQFRREP